MPLAALLLFTHTEFIDALWKYGPFGLALATLLYKHFTGPSKEAEESAKKERKEMSERLVVVEKCQDKNVPAFTEHLGCTDNYWSQKIAEMKCTIPKKLLAVLS